MGLAYIEGAGGGGVRSSDVTASAADILSGKYDLTAQSDDEVVPGTMPNNGTVNHSLPINGSFTIAKGYHSGSGKVTQSITTKAAATYYATTSDQTISSGQYLSGAQTIKKLTQTNLTGANIKPGVTISVNNGNANVWSVAGTMASKAAATYYPTTSDQTISSGQYLSGNQVIKAVSQQNLVAGNIKKGVTVYVKNGSGNIFAVTGTFEGWVPTSNNLYYYGTNTANLAYYGSTLKYATFNANEITFTGETGSGGYVGYCLGSKTFQINGDRFSKCTISGNLFLHANVQGATNGIDVYVDLMDSTADYSRVGTYKYRLGTYTYTSTSNTVTLSSMVVNLSPRGATGYVRIWFQGFYVSDGTKRTTLGYSLGTTANPASIRSIVLS